MKDTILVAGAPGSGKTGARSATRRILEGSGLSCHFLTDGEFLVGIVEEDARELWHVHPHKGNPAFCITNQHPLDETVRRWVANVPEPREGQINLIEVARGVGSRFPKLDISFGRLLKADLVPKEIWRRSIVVYVRCPRHLRFAWNEDRRNNPRIRFGEKSFYCPTLAMKTLFASSDFTQRLMPGLEKMGVPVWVINNNKEGVDVLQKRAEEVALRILKKYLSIEDEPGTKESGL